MTLSWRLCTMIPVMLLLTASGCGTGGGVDNGGNADTGPTADLAAHDAYEPADADSAVVDADDSGTAPDDSVTTPDDSTTMPDDSTTMPDDSTTAADDSGTVADAFADEGVDDIDSAEDVPGQDGLPADDSGIGLDAADAADADDAVIDDAQTDIGSLECVPACQPGFGCSRGACVATGAMAAVPAGAFWMGCNSLVDSACAADELPYHEVTLQGYYIDVTEVTVAAYRVCVDAGDCAVPDIEWGFCVWGIEGTDDYPMGCVNWAEAAAYCAWAGKRLPTEAEWEKAARGADGRRYPWGNALATCEFAFMKEDGQYGCGVGNTWKVCSRSPVGDSPYGLCDMAGGVWEWVADWYGDLYYDGSPASDPTGPDTGVKKVGRGGAFNQDAAFLRTSTRGSVDPGYRHGSVGFRCARSI